MSDPHLMANSVPMGRAYEILEDGKTFGSYLIVRCLAYDMLGSLYLVQNQQTSQRETLFVFPSLVTQDRTFPDRFANQTKKLCTLKHPNLLGFSQPILIQNSYCLVGEAFEGLSIPDHLMLLTGSQLSTSENKAATNLPPAQVTPIVEQVLAGLAYAHDNKTMHLNLNPTKILRSGFGEVKVYGYHFLAILGQELFEMLVSAGIPPLKLDPNRSYLGTTDILSPEARLRQNLEYRSDIYAVGVNTHWLLTGRKPTSPYQPPSQVIAGIEPGWDAFTLHCLQRKPDDRYATASAALADLRNLAQLTPIVLQQPLELMLGPELPAETPAEKKKDAAKVAAAKKVKGVKPPRRARKPLTPVQRLLFIGLPSLALVAIAAFIYVTVETSDDELPGDLPATLAADGQIPRLWLTISPRESIVRIDKIVFPVKSGELKLKIASGVHEISIEAPPKFRPKRENYTVQAKPDHIYFNLVPNWAIVDFSTAPGATITVQPEKGPARELGVADEKGALRTNEGLGDGNYTFSATKEDYTTVQIENQKIELTKTYHLDLKLVPKLTTVHLVTDKPGVTVRLGDKVLGQTPLNTTDIPVDTDVRLTLDLPGYQSVTRRVYVRPGTDDTINFGSLEARTGELNLGFKLAGRAPTPEEMRDAKITIDGHSYPATTQHVPDMIEGPHKITFDHPNYFPEELPFDIAAGKTTTVAKDLKPRAARLVIHPTPVVPIAVSANNQPLPRNPDGSFILPPNQAIKVRVDANNYSSNVRDFKPGPNAQLSWEVPMSNLPPPEIGKPYNVPYINLALKWISPGDFLMGSPGAEIERKVSEGPLTTVHVPVGFWAGETEVTQSQYREIMNENPSEFGQGQNDPNWANFPVEKVTWKKAVEFAQKLTEREAAALRLPAGFEFRLPTEAEWEYIARAGSTTPFSWGDHADSSMANFKGSYPRASGGSKTSGNTVNGTQPVKSYPPNSWGLYDVYGNVGEWVLDAYRSNLPGGAITAPALIVGPADAKHIYRGGDWLDDASSARSAWRDENATKRPDAAYNTIGLRVLLAPVIPPPAKP